MLELRSQERSWNEVARIINERHNDDWYGGSLMEASGPGCGAGPRDNSGAGRLWAT
jgi:hypothetical protein